MTPKAPKPAGLTYTGGPDGYPAVRGVPARDLTDHDLARAAWEAADPRPATQNDVPEAAITALRDRLIATGLYVPKED